MGETRIGRAAVYVLPVMLLACMAVGAALFYLNQRSPAVRVGRLSDFPPSANPYRVQVDNHIVFVVNTGAELLILEPRYTTSTGHSSYDVVWVPTNGRYEDPSSGAKFTLTGEWLDVNYLSGIIDSRGLSRYPVEVRRDELWVTAMTPLPGRLVATAGPK